MRARRDHTDARPQHGAAQVFELTDGLAYGFADAGDELDLTAMKLALDLAAIRVANPLQHVGGGVEQTPARAIHDEQLFLDTERERRRLAKVVGLVAHDAAMYLPTTTSKRERCYHADIHPLAGRRRVRVRCSSGTWATTMPGCGAGSRSGLARFPAGTS
jgi:hypothetical protein